MEIVDGVLAFLVMKKILKLVKNDQKQVYNWFRVLTKVIDLKIKIDLDHKRSFSALLVNFTKFQLQFLNSSYEKT